MDIQDGQDKDKPSTTDGHGYTLMGQAFHRKYRVGFILPILYIHVKQILVYFISPIAFLRRARVLSFPNSMMTS